MTPKFPEKPMRVGDTFDVPQQVEMPVPGIPGGKMKMDGRTVFTLDQIGLGDALFSLETSMTMDAGAEGAAASAMKLEGSGRGTATFDRTQGIMTRFSMNMSMQMEMDMSQLIQAPAGEAERARCR